METLLPILTFICLLLVTFTIFQIVRGRVVDRAHLARRLESLGQPHPQEAHSLLQEKTYSAIPQLNRLLARTEFIGHLDKLVLQAGIRLRAGEIVLWMCLLGMMFALATLLWTDNLAYSAVAFSVFGPGLVLFWLRSRRKTRRGAIVRQLPDTLEMIRSALQAGYSLPQALEAVVEEVPDPIRAEFLQVTEELRLGHALRGAFQGLYDRTGIEDLRMFTVAVLINREVGGNLSEIIDAVNATIRERFKLKAQIRSLTAQGRFSALILCLLTPALLTALTLVNSQYLHPLYHTTLGRWALGYAALSTALGYFVMTRIISIKVVRAD